LTSAEIAANPVLNPGQVESVIVYSQPNDYSRYSDLSTGQAQIVQIFSANWNLVANNSQYGHFVLPVGAPDLEALAINTQIKPTNNVWIRRAIVNAINYTGLIAAAYGGLADPFMGPETPNYGVYYNPAQLPPYQFNLTAVKYDLANAGYPNGVGMPSLWLRTIAGCVHCAIAAEEIQDDLANVGITVNVVTAPPSNYWNTYGSYQTNLQNAYQLDQLSFLGGPSYIPDYLGPSDYWVGFVTNSSAWGNWAVYNNPRVDQDVSLLTSTANQSQQIKALSDAQQQIYNDAPYAWLGTYKLWNVEGSIVWNKSVIQSMLFDPNYGGTDTAPLINTIILT
jgi:ABC-type transport system substrate-binding protein